MTRLQITIRCYGGCQYSEDQLRYIFFRGLTSTSQHDALLCGITLPFDDLVKKMIGLVKMSDLEREAERNKLSEFKDHYKEQRQRFFIYPVY